MSTRRPLLVASPMLALALAASAFASPSRAGEAAEALSAPAAFERLKTLVGTWKGGEGDTALTVTYRLTGNGSALIETSNPGSDQEMVSVYHLDGPDLRMTHYCAIGNQPRMVLDRTASTPDTLVFAFDGGTNLDPAKDMHVHEGRLTLADTDHLHSEWTGYQDGQPAGNCAVELTRQAD